jgi:hypothetical protein
MLAAGSAACGSSFDPSTALDGTWMLTPPGVPGSGLHFSISDDGGTVSGSGERLIEAGPTLPFTVSGTQQGDAVSLTLAYPTGGPDTFSGRLTDATHLTGTLRTAEGAAADAEFARVYYASAARHSPARLRWWNWKDG